MLLPGRRPAQSEEAGQGMAAVRPPRGQSDAGGPGRVLEKARRPRAHAGRAGEGELGPEGAVPGPGGGVRQQERLQPRRLHRAQPALHGGQRLGGRKLKHRQRGKSRPASPGVLT